MLTTENSKLIHLIAADPAATKLLRIVDDYINRRTEGKFCTLLQYVETATSEENQLFGAMIRELIESIKSGDTALIESA